MDVLDEQILEQDLAEQKLLTMHGVCERCDRECDDIVMRLEPDNSRHYICWSCLSRAEKYINLKPHWRRPRRGGIVNNPYQSWS
jgi:hypothetical protein